MNRARAWATCLVVALAVAGCARKTPSPVGTGAKETVENFYAAIVQQDWLQAHSFLAPESQRHYPSGEFRRLAENYRRSLHFEPDTVQVQSCEEHGTEAIAHVVFMGKAESRQKRFKDAVSLRRGDDGWRVVLSPNFGRAARP